MQGYVVFTYDDFQSGQAKPPYLKPLNHMTAMQEKQFQRLKRKLAQVEKTRLRPL